MTTIRESKQIYQAWLDMWEDLSAAIRLIAETGCERDKKDLQNPMSGLRRFQTQAYNYLEHYRLELFAKWEVEESE